MRELAGPLTAVAAAAVLVLVVGEARGSRAAAWTRAIAKTIASLAFVVVGVARGALEAAWSAALFASLVCAVAGDLFLLSHARRFFLAGLFAFLLGHVAYVIAFLARGVAAGGALASAPVVLVVIVVVGRWLLPRVQGGMRGPVLAYMAVISLMVVAAAATVAHHRSVAIALGAPAFFLSDLAVARDRFVKGAFVNRLWGLPVYYAAQFLLAWSP
jgi:uncharacterized membrane protein YhhN